VGLFPWWVVGRAAAQAQPTHVPAASAPAGACSVDPLQCSRDRLTSALALAAHEGPNYDTAWAWLELAKAEPVDGQPNRPHVRQAFQTLKVVLSQYRRSKGAGRAADEADIFRDRLLPIFQAAADAIAFDRLASGSPSTDRALIAELLELGEMARRAQIDIVLADSCEPLQVPLKPKDLLAEETIVYPVVGRRHTYLLVGKKPGTGHQPLSREGWTAMLAGKGSGAKEVGDLADELINGLPLAASSHAAEGSTADSWGAAKAQSLYSRLVEPLENRFLPDGEPKPDTLAPTLIFFPDPILRNVPWALLHGGPKKGLGEPDYLVRRAAIAVGPGLGYVRPSPRPQHRGQLLLGGLDEDNLRGFVSTTAREPDLSPRISDALFGPNGMSPPQPLQEQQPQDPVITGPFTRRRLETELVQGGFSAVLLATHASYVSGASYIQIHASGSSKPVEMKMTEIEAKLREGRRRAVGLDLLILMACEGAVAKAGDLGLAGAALRGGASSTIGALTVVQVGPAISYFGNALDPDQDFLSRYYDSKSRRSPAQALRDVQLYYLGIVANPDAGIVGDSAPDSPAAYPGNWGVFVVIGSWR
jgi:hypothetical protein